MIRGAPALRGPIAAVLALLVVAVASPPAQAVQDLPPREVERLLREGTLALESARNQLQRGQDEVAGRRLREAEEAFGRILAADVTHVEAAVGMAAIYYLTRRHEAAIELLEPLARRHPDDVDVAHQLGLNLYRQGRTDQAMPLLERAATAGDRADAMWLLAVHHYRVAAWDEGLSFAARYVETRPDDARALGLLGTYYLKLDRYDEAVAALDRFLEVDPDNVSARINRANALFRGGRIPEAARAYESLLEAHPDRLRLVYNLAAIRMRQGRYADAVPLLERFLEREPAHATALYFLADCRIRLDRLEAARETLERVVELTPNNPWAHHGLSRVAERTGRPGDAFHHAEEAVELAPDEWELSSRYGTLLRRAGRPAEALDWHDRAARSAPDQPRIAVERGRDLWALDRLEEAEDAFARAASLDGELAVAREALAATRTRLGARARSEGRLEEARDRLAAALEAAPGYGPAAVNLGLLELETGQPEAALDALGRATRGAEADVAAARAAALAAVGRPEEARRAVAQALESGTTLRPLALRLRGRLAAERGDWAEAADAFAAAAEEDPSGAAREAGALARLREGLGALAEGREGRALEALGAAEADRSLLGADDRRRLDLARAVASVAASPDAGRARRLQRLLAERAVVAAAGGDAVAAARVRLARAFLRLDRHDAALETLADVRGRSPAAAAARALEVAALDRRARDLYAAGSFEEAGRIWRRLARRGDAPALAHDLAAARFAQGRVDDAARTWRRQVEAGGPAEAWFNLALVMDRRGEYREAWGHMREYLERGGSAAERTRGRVEAKEAVFGFGEGRR